MSTPTKDPAVVAKALKDAADKQLGAVAAAIYQEACEVMRASLHLVPVRTGRLRASNYVTPPADLHKPESFAGYGVSYALAVHETHPTKHDFLYNPLMAALSGYAARVAARTQANLRNGVGLNVRRELPAEPQE